MYTRKRVHVRRRTRNWDTTKTWRCFRRHYMCTIVPASARQPMQTTPKSPATCCIKERRTLLYVYTNMFTYMLCSCIHTYIFRHMRACVCACACVYVCICAWGCLIFIAYAPTKSHITIGWFAENDFEVQAQSLTFCNIDAPGIIFTLDKRHDFVIYVLWYSLAYLFNRNISKIKILQHSTYAWLRVCIVCVYTDTDIDTDANTHKDMQTHTKAHTRTRVCTRTHAHTHTRTHT